MSSPRRLSSSAAPTGSQRYSVTLSWKPTEVDTNDSEEPLESPGPRLTELGPIFDRPNTVQSLTKASAGAESNVSTENETITVGGGEQDQEKICSSCGEKFPVAAITKSDTPAPVKCFNCAKAASEAHLSDYLAREGPPLGATIITPELPYMSLWEVTQSWRWDTPRLSYATPISRVDTLLNLCQKSLSQCPDEQIAALLELTSAGWNLPILRETLLERVSFSHRDFGITNERDLEQIHILRLCGTSTGTRYQPNRVEEWSGPQNKILPTKRRRSSVVSAAAETLRSGRVVTLEQVVMEYEIALKHGWNRLQQIIQDQLVRSNTVSSMWIVAMYLQCESVEAKCVDEIHSRGPAFYLRLEDEKLLPSILISKLMEQLTVSIRRASVCSTGSQMASCGAAPIFQDEMDWGDLENYSLGYCMDAAEEGDASDDDDDDDGEEEYGSDTGSHDAHDFHNPHLSGVSSPGSDNTGTALEESDTLARQISEAAMEFVRNSSSSN